MVKVKIDALQVAQDAGLQLKRRGGKHWACCPIHGEKTASMCFYPDGKWHCFGCNAHGDAADLYAALHGITLGEALRAVTGNSRIQRREKTPGEKLKEQVDEWKEKAWADACRTFHNSGAIMEAAEDWDMMFIVAAEARAAAQDFMNFLETATPAQLVKAFLEEKKDAAETKRRNERV